MIRDFPIVPAVDMLEGRAVRLLRGDYAHVTVDAGDPFALIRLLAASGPPLLHVVALGAARDGSAPLELAREAVTAAAPVPVQLGGGVRTVADAEALVAAGVTRVIVGTAAFGPLPLTAFVDALGDRLAVAIDVAGGIVRTAGWLESARVTTAEALERCTDAGVTHVVCTAIERDGAAAGPDLELLREVRRGFGGTVLAAGGIRDAADVEAVQATGVDGVVVGRAFLDGTLELGG
ncbi:MAG: 1-(5-phosphoribosyl)-5-[(5-phosphoribosylamino)methylideneamino] imidazole-4-carboxamide isomerase [Gaiellaceae bacterium]